MKLKIDHIGYIVKELQNSKNYFTKYYNFKPLTKTICEKAHGVKLMFLDMGTNTVPAEIIQPLNKNPRFTIFQNSGENYHHIAYEVDSIEKSLNYLKKKIFYR